MVLEQVRLMVERLQLTLEVEVVEELQETPLMEELVEVE